MLKYYLVKLAEGTFVFQVEEQSDRVTNYIKSRPGKYFAARNGWKVAIDNEPAIDLDRKTIWLQGRDSDADDTVVRVWGLGGKECKNVVKAINDALTEAVEAAKNWRINTPKFVQVVEIRKRFDPFDPFYGLGGIVVIRD